MEVATTPVHRSLSLALLAWAEFIIALDVNIVYMALPDIGRDIGFSPVTLQLVVSIYAVAFGGFLLLGGRCADRLGHRRMFLLAVSLFALASLGGALAPSAEVLVAARAVQGLGGALLFPTTLALVTTLFREGRERNRALAVWGGAGSLGLSLGSVVGGALTGAYGWQMVFYTNVVMACVAAALALPLLPRDGRRSRSGTFDLRGALTGTGGATLLVVVLVRGPESGWTDPVTIVGAILAAALLAAFLLVESRSPDPLLPTRLLHKRTLAAAMVVTFLFGIADGSVPYFFTVYFQDVHGFSPLRTGLAFLVPAGFIVIGTLVAERVVARIGVRGTLITGSAIGLAGTAALAWGMAAGEGSYPQVVPGLVGWGLGQGLVWTAMWVLAASDIDPGEQGVASGMASTGLQVGIAFGLAVTIAAANSGLTGLTGRVRLDRLGENMPYALSLTAVALALSVLTALLLSGSDRTGTHTAQLN